MNDECLDSLSRDLAAGASRRSALAALAGAGLAGALAVVGAPGAAAGNNNRNCRRLFRRCNTAGDCCGNRRKVACDAVQQSRQFCGRADNKDRCCRPRGQRCDNSCDCCDPFVCIRDSGGGSTCQRALASAEIIAG